MLDYKGKKKEFFIRVIIYIYIYIYIYIERERERLIKVVVIVFFMPNFFIISIFFDKISR